MEHKVTPARLYRRLLDERSRSDSMHYLGCSTGRCGLSRGNPHTTPQPRRAKVMNGSADESLLINYGGNRVLLTR